MANMTKAEKMAEVWAVFNRVIGTQTEFTSDTLYLMSDESAHKNIAIFAAAVFKRAKKRGLIIKSDRCLVSQRPKQASKVLPVWISAVKEADWLLPCPSF